MAIRMICSCGQEMATEDQHAGKKVRCPSCQGVLIVPGVAPVVAQVDDAPYDDDIEDYRPSRPEGVSKREGLRRGL